MATSESNNYSISIRGSFEKIVACNMDLYVLDDASLPSFYSMQRSAWGRCLLKELQLKGINALPVLINEFTFVLIDKTTRNIYYCRPVPTSNPVYIRDNSGGIVFGAKIEDLFLSSEEIRPDQIGIVQYLHCQYSAAPRTVVQDVKKAGVGILYRKTLGGVGVKLDFASWANRSLPSGFTDAQLKEHIRNIYKKLALKLESPVALFCSGGIDSTTNALRLWCQDIAATLLTASFQDESYDEAKYASMVARKTGFPHKTVVAAGMSYPEAKLAIQGLSEPICDRAIIPTWKLVSETTSVSEAIVSGEGGDELWGLPRRWTRQDINDANKFSVKELVDAFLEKGACVDIEQLAAWIEADIDYTAAAKELSQELTSMVALSGIEGAAKTLKLLQCTTWLAENVIQKDKSIHYSLGKKLFFPLADKLYLELIFGSPDNCDSYLYGDKKPLRQMILEHDMESIVSRPKQKFKVPASIWTTGSIGAAIDLLAKSDSILFQTIRRARFSQEWALVRSGAAGNDRLIWGLFVLHEWFESLRSKVPDCTEGNLFRK